MDQTSALPAEVAAGGVRVNIIPKDGGNQLRGGGFFGGTASSWQANNLTQDLIDKGFSANDGSAALAIITLANVIARYVFGAPIPRTTAMTCERVYRVCPNVVPANPSEAAACADAFRSRCGAELRQHVQCTMGKCDDAGAVDRLAVERLCLATLEAYRSCEEEDAGEGGVDEGQLPPFVVDSGPGDAGTRD